VSQLRLVNGGHTEIQKICGMALQFEKSSFDSSPDKVGSTKLEVNIGLANSFRILISRLWRRNCSN
jgi:hypothetical protein